MILVCVESWPVLHATLRSALGAFITNTVTTLHPTGNDCLEFLDGDVHPQDNVNVSENDEPSDEPVSESLDSCTEAFIPESETMPTDLSTVAQQ